MEIMVSGSVVDLADIFRRLLQEHSEAVSALGECNPVRCGTVCAVRCGVVCTVRNGTEGLPFMCQCFSQKQTLE
jgi:hypothetical protein